MWFSEYLTLKLQNNRVYIAARLIGSMHFVSYKLSYFVIFGKQCCKIRKICVFVQVACCFSMQHYIMELLTVTYFC